MGDFNSNAMCCACGGGSTAGDEGEEGGDEGDEGSDDGSDEGEDDSVDAGGIGECRNTNILDGEILGDRSGDACDEYTEANAESWCGNYDEGDFNSNAMCCACGGGSTAGDEGEEGGDEGDEGSDDGSDEGEEGGDEGDD